MKINEIKNKDKLTIEWSVIIPSEKVNIELNKKYSELQNQLNLPGFRPGKVPLEIVKKRFGQKSRTCCCKTFLVDLLKTMLPSVFH